MFTSQEAALGTHQPPLNGAGGEAPAAGPWCEDGSVIYPANKASGSFYSLPGAPQAHVSTCLEARDKEQNKGQEATTLPFLEAACAAHRDVGTSRDGHPSFGHLPNLVRRLSRIV